MSLRSRDAGFCNRLGRKRVNQLISWFLCAASLSWLNLIASPGFFRIFTVLVSCTQGVEERSLRVSIDEASLSKIE